MAEAHRPHCSWKKHLKSLTIKKKLMRLGVQNTSWEKEFDKKFPDITHVGCAGNIRCGTMANDVKSFIRKYLSQREKEIVEEVEKLKRTKKRLLGVDGVTDETHDAGINYAVDKVLSILKQ